MARVLLICTITALALYNNATAQKTNDIEVTYEVPVYGDIPTVEGCEPDVMIGDCTNDIGDEPNNSCGYVSNSPYLWNSPYIWVRNQQDGFTNFTNQSPIGGGRNYIYVALHNRSAYTLNSGDVHVYFSKASTGLYWPTNWDNYSLPNCNIPPVPLTITYGDEIGFATIISLAPGQDAIVQIPWDPTPDPADFCDPDARHFCLLARLISPEDPMTYIETSSTPYNTQYNNNIAWKNLTILDRTYPNGPVDVYNGTKEQRRGRLVFTVPEAEREDDILDHAKVQVDLGAKLKDIWVSNGKQGNNIESGDGNTIWLKGFEATVEGLTLEPEQREEISVNIIFDSEAEDGVFNFDLAQYDDDAPGEEGEAVKHLVGGERFTVTFADEAGRNVEAGGHAATAPGRNALAEALQLTVHPNPTRGLTTISYTLPADMRITLSIYDVTGKLVRTLVPGEDQKAGTHTIEWNGTTVENNAVTSGTYFYRIETPRGTAQSRLSITR